MNDVEVNLIEGAIDLIADLIISKKITGGKKKKALDAIDLLAEVIEV